VRVNEPTVFGYRRTFIRSYFTCQRDDAFYPVYKTIYRSKANSLIDIKMDFGFLRALP
jgi:hypothetical protein